MQKTHKIFFRIIFVISLGAMLGSLYFSNFGDPLADIRNWTLFQGPGMDPCPLCRWGRILMYPIVLLSGLALLRKNKEYIVPIIVLATIGIYLAAYHYTIQFVNLPRNTTCSIYAPCNVVDRSLFTYITLPGLEFSAFLVIAICGWKIRKIKER